MTGQTSCLEPLQGSLLSLPHSSGPPVSNLVLPCRPQGGCGAQL